MPAPGNVSLGVGSRMHTISLIIPVAAILKFQDAVDKMS